MKMKLILLVIAVFAVSGDSQAMMRRAQPRQRAALRNPVNHSARNMSQQAQLASPLGKFVERIKPTPQMQYLKQLREVKENKFPLTYCAESRITREILLNHAKHDELCEKWLNAKRNLTWNRAQYWSSWALLVPIFVAGSPRPHLLEHPALCSLVAAAWGYMTPSVNDSKNEKKNIERELAELAEKHKILYKISDDIQ